MKLSQMFVKPVDRKIEGVIKADDLEGLRNEVEEYVLTNEIEKRLEDFLEEYNHYATANGVWISGFFGSGKSHLLKMLALLLENQPIDGISVYDEFRQKCHDNAMLSGALQKAVSIPSESILFNIDQKADIISKTDIDALLSVFVKVFDEHCDYYGKQAYIAHFERKLDQEGQLDAFKAAFEQHAGQTWAWGCEQIIRVSSSVDAAFEEVTGEKVTDVIDKFRSDYRLSIEDFAVQVHQYIQRKPKNFRLNFFVDEVGQYIADNVKLMTNLQTIAESLATHCHGQAWIIVTAQEDMNTVIGELGKQQSNDFSKIQARFAKRMKLTSADVAEVIQKRLLKKTSTGEGELQVLYDHEKNNFRTLLEFEGGMQFKNYQSQEHFVSCYPFVPYQFELFQLAIRNLSQHNAFEGKHSSIGERSMLGVFQEVAKKIADHELGDIATFDLMFEGIRSALKGPIQHTINLAERQLDNPLAIRLVKALFLVKYVTEFKPTLRNLCVLMLENFDQDVEQLRNRVEESLNQLVSQVYIQRTGDIYEYLTDDEKDVEQEIKNTDIDNKDVADHLQKIIFDSVIKLKKIRYEENKHDFPFTRRLDDTAFGREQDLSINVISPLHPEYGRSGLIAGRSMAKHELTVVLPANDRMLSDLFQYKKTEKYVSQNISMTQKDSIKRILGEKQVANQHRNAELTRNVEDLLANAEMYVHGSPIESKSQDPTTRVIDGFEQLVTVAYPNLRMLRGLQYTEDKIAIYLEDESFFEGSDPTEAETEVFSFITRRDSPPEHRRTSVKDLVEAFEYGNYGWPLPAILCIVAQLINRGKLQVRQDSELMDGKKLVDALRNTKAHANCILEPKVEVPQSQIRKMKEFYESFFDQPAKGTEPKTLEPELAASFAEMATELTGYAARSNVFPFVADLQQPLQTIKSLAKRKEFFNDEFEVMRDELLDAKEDVIEPIVTFMNGSQAKLYEDARSFIQQNDANFAYVDGTEESELKTILGNPKCYAGKTMQGVKTLLDSLKAKVAAVAKREQDAVEASVRAKADKLTSIDGFDTLPEDCRKEIDDEVNRAISYIRSQRLIAVVRESGARFENQQYGQMLTRVDAKIKAQNKTTEDEPVVTDPLKTVTLSSIKVNSDKTWLVSPEDVQEYIDRFQQALLETLDGKTRIQV